MASIEARKFKSGTFYRAQVRRRGYPPISRTFDTITEARAWARQVEADMDRRVHVDFSKAERTTLGEVLDLYLEQVTPDKRGAVQERNRIKCWKNHPLSHRFLSDIEVADIHDFVRQRKKGLIEFRASKRGPKKERQRRIAVSDSTITKDLAVLSHLFANAKKFFRITVANPFHELERADRLASSRKRQRRLQPGEYERILDAIKQRKHPWLRAALHLGDRNLAEAKRSHPVALGLD